MTVIFNYRGHRVVSSDFTQATEKAAEIAAQESEIISAGIPADVSDYFNNLFSQWEELA
jgi:hypothetical protein